MDSFTVAIKITPTNKAIPSLGASHLCHAPSLVTLCEAFVDLMGDYEGPPGTSANPPGKK